MTTDRPDFWDQVYPARTALGPGQIRLVYSWTTGTAIPAGETTAPIEAFEVPTGYKLYVSDVFVSCEASCIQKLWLLDYDGDTDYVFTPHSFDMSAKVEYTDLGAYPIVAGNLLRFALTNNDTVARHFWGSFHGTYELI